jgi:hypothetical protein
MACRRWAQTNALKGPHFTLLAIGDEATNMSETDWPGRGATLRTIQIPTAGATRLSEIYGLGGPAHVLVRPDGYIASPTARRARIPGSRIRFD